MYIKYVTTIYKMRHVWRWWNVTSFILGDLKGTGHIFRTFLLLFYLCMLCFIYLFIFLLCIFLRAIFCNFLCNLTKLSGNVEIFLIKAGSPALHFLFWCHMNGNFKFPHQSRHSLDLLYVFLTITSSHRFQYKADVVINEYSIVSTFSNGPKPSINLPPISITLFLQITHFQFSILALYIIISPKKCRNLCRDDWSL